MAWTGGGHTSSDDKFIWPGTTRVFLDCVIRWVALMATEWEGRECR